MHQKRHKIKKGFTKTVNVLMLSLLREIGKSNIYFTEFHEQSKETFAVKFIISKFEVRVPATESKNGYC